MSKKLFTFLFILVLFLGVFVRFYKLGEVPNSLDWDEVSQGYNASMLLTTGRDEFGVSFPSTIRSFNDYKPPIYTYLTILPVKVFGLNPFSARFPSALFGSLSVLLVYGLVYEIFRKEKYAKTVALLSMFFFAISPYSIQFSRTGFDANVGVFLAILGTWIFIMGLNRKIIWQVFLGTLFLGLSAYSSHSEKVFAPLFFLCLIFYGRKFFLSKKVIAICLVALFGFINIFWFFNSQTRARSGGVLFTSSAVQDFLNISSNELAFDKLHNDKFDALLHNRRLVYADKFVQNYLSHFDFNNLFVNGDNARHHAPGVGIIYLASLPFILAGAFFIIRRKIYPGFILFAWIIIAPLASSFAIDAPNFQRSLIFLPGFNVFEALGCFYIFSVLSRVKFSRIFMGIIIILFSFNVCYYFHQYFAYTNSEYGQYWQSGYKEAIDFTDKLTNKRIFFDNNIEQGYIFYLFYNQYDPRKYLLGNGSNRINPKCYTIENAYFGTCQGMISKGDIYVTGKPELSPDYRVIKTIVNPGGEPTVWILEHQ
jgi:4-amino-4-deoxy-L-arabinose transferase-like glycosyltransferase